MGTLTTLPTIPADLRSRIKLSDESGVSMGIGARGSGRLGQPTERSFGARYPARRTPPRSNDRPPDFQFD